MVRCVSIAVALACAALLVSACAPPPAPYRVVPIDWTGGITRSVADVSYGPDPMHRLDVYRGGGGRATIVFLHGGGWTGGDKNQWFPSLLLHEVARGYDVVSINYRLAPWNPFPAAVHDAAAAVRWVREKGAAFGIEVTRIVLAGHSAGANIAALAAFGSNGKFPGGTLEPVEGSLLLAGAFDFSSLDHQGLSGPKGWLSPHDAKRLASATTWLDAQDPPTMAVHGVEDMIVPVQQARGLQQRSAVAAHGSRFEYLEVTSTALEPKCRGHVPWCGAPVDQVDAFLDRVAG